MNKRILLVEDDQDSQTVVTQIAKHLHYFIDVAGSAEEASELLFETELDYDLIIIDLRLPGKNGWQLFSIIKENPTTAHVPCIATTGYGDSLVAREAKAAGFEHFMAKPITAKTVVDLFEEFFV